jgi:hypothetical protein
VVDVMFYSGIRDGCWLYADIKHGGLKKEEQKAAVFAIIQMIKDW